MNSAVSTSNCSSVGCVGCTQGLMPIASPACHVTWVRVRARVRARARARARVRVRVRIEVGVK